jgi:pre-mRNA-splicing factor SYF1
MSADAATFLEEEQDFEYEEEILRNPYNLKLWLRYLATKKNAPSDVRNVLYERAVKLLPRSYKLWNMYLTERRIEVQELCIVDRKVEAVNNCYERALVHLHKMPRIWLDYLAFMMKQKKGTSLRRSFDRCLQSLPITQHSRIWKLYLKWVREFGVWESAVRVYRRHLKFNPRSREEYVDYLKSLGHYEEASEQLAIIVNDEDFQSKEGKTSHQLWMELCEMITMHPEQVSSGLKVDDIIRSGLRKFTDQVGRLWCTLADYYIRLGQFERARDVYEEAIESVVTVRDFSLAFDAFAQFEESMLTAKMEMVEEEEAEEGEKDDDDLDVDGNDVDMRLARLEHLMDRRPVLLSSVLLRQNPHNCNEWLKRVKLFESDPRKTIVTYTEAVKTIDPEQAVGKLHVVWMEFAKYYEKHGDLANARVVFTKATKVNFKFMDELAMVWTEFAMMEVRHEHNERALTLMKQATQEPPRQQRLAQRRKKGDADAMAAVPVTERIHRSTKVWALYLDLEENLGTTDSTRTAYEKLVSVST